MSGTRGSDSVILNPIITLFQLSDYAKKLNDSDRQLYLAKLVKCDIDCPFYIHSQLWKTTAKEIEELCPSITEQDLYRFLISQRSDNTGHQLRAFKSIIAGSEMVEKGWVTKLCALRLTSGTVLIKGRVKHSMSFNSLPDLHTWAAIHEDCTVMAGHCTCVAG
jgi:hypothetical protein